MAQIQPANNQRRVMVNEAGLFGHYYREMSLILPGCFRAVCHRGADAIESASQIWSVTFCIGDLRYYFVIIFIERRLKFYTVTLKNKLKMTSG